MYIISPMSNCGSVQKRDRFLELLTAVADVTAKSEPDVSAYAWFVSAGDNDTVPHHWVRGFEVYNHLEASTKTHRESVAYQRFRRACGSENLLDRASDLRYLEPLNIGFLLQKNGSIILQDQQENDGRSSYVVMETLQPSEDSRNRLLDYIQQLAVIAEGLGDAVTTFWALGYRPEYQDPTVLLVQRFSSREKYLELFRKDAAVKQIRDCMHSILESQQLTTWRDAGIGFIGREK